MKERFKLVPAVYLIVKNGNKILLSLRKNTGYMDGYYGLVSGHVDGNEPARFACIREAMEEAGMEISMEELKIGCMMHRLTSERECMDIFFVLEDYYGKLENMEPEKCDGLKYFDMDNLPENIIPYVDTAIKNSLNNMVYCEYWFKL
jgi:ADP-ribose pyrophosphatase YjhB (NUDIX family)